MPYKDKDKQREAQRERTRRYRNKLKGVTHKPNRNAQDVTPVTPVVIPELEQPAEQWVGELTKERQTSAKGFNRCPSDASA